MWEINISNQALSLLWSVILGFAAALFYDFLRAINKTFRPRNVLVFIFDILFWLVMTVAFFVFFMVFTNGQVRMFAFFGALAGFLFSFLAFSKIWLFVFIKIFCVIRFVLLKIKGIFSGLGCILVKIFKILKKSLKKAVLNLKKS